MKAARLIRPGTIELQEIPEPEIRLEHEVLLKIENAGICGSDIHYYKEGRIGDQIIDYPFTIGHECTATVVKTGKNTRRVNMGDRVTIDPAVSCGSCDQCRIGRPHTCRQLKFLGCPGQREGCLAEYIVMPEQNCYPLPKNMPSARGVLAEPLSISLYALRLMNPKQSDTVAILGSGPIGLCTALASKQAGINKIFMTDKIDDRLQAASKAGAVWTGNPDKSNIGEEIMDFNHQELDAVIECCGDQSALDQALSLLKPGGHLLIIGIPGKNRVSFDAHQMRRKEIKISNVRRQNGCTAEAISFLDEVGKDVDFMLTHFFELQDSGTAFDLLSDYKDGVIKAVVKFT
jgi:L-iditol 2-dehydrogenase